MSTTTNSPITNSLNHSDEQRIIDRIAKDGGYGSKMARAIFIEVVRFLRMIGHNRHAPSVPSRMVDDGWHTFLTYTRCYRHFCQQECGGFVDHEPNDHEQKQPLSSADTVAYMEAQAIQYDKDLWRDTTSDCNDCWNGLGR